MDRDYDIGDHYWIVAGDETRAWSSAVPGYVAAGDPGFAAWQASGGEPTRIASEADLDWVFNQRGMWRLSPRACPPAITRLQGRLALYSAHDGNGTPLLTLAEAAVVAAGGSMAIYWEDAQTWERDHPLIVQIGAALGLDAAAMDQLFADASAL